MIFAAFFGVAALQAQEPMKWTGEVRAFNYYLNSDCNPEQRMHVVYVARKRFEDGFTVTLVRSVPVGAYQTARPSTSAQGFIERDPTGAATKIVTLVRMIGTSEAKSEYSLDPKKGVLTGWGTLGMSGSTSKGLTLTNPREYLLDPLEGFAFGNLSSLSAGWLFPATTYGYVDSRAPTVGMQIVFGAPSKFAYDLGGKRRMFLKVDMMRRWIGSSIAKEPEYAGSILFNQDGTLAAYSPWVGFSRLPGTSLWTGGYSGGRNSSVGPPPFELKGALAKAWEDGPNPAVKAQFALDAILGVFVPAKVSAAEQSSLLAAIPDREKPGDGSGR